MEKITKTYEVYNFDELEKNIQEKLIDEWAEDEITIFCENGCLEEDMTNEAENILNETFGENTCENIQTYYDLSYCQGSGAMISYETYLENINKKLKIFTEKEEKIFAEYGSLIKIKHSSNYYYHENSFTIDVMDLYYSLDYAFNNDEITENKQKKLEQKIEKLEQKLNDITYTMNCELKNYGYSILEDYEHWKEEAKFRLDNYTFLKSGEIFE